MQPGPGDAGWAPGTPQTFEIFFGLVAAPAGECRLELDFADTHSSGPPKLRVQVNDFTTQSQAPKGAGDASISGEPAKGRPWVMTLDLAGDKLKAGENRIAVTTLTGSWVLWDAVHSRRPRARSSPRCTGPNAVHRRRCHPRRPRLHEGKPAHVINLSVCQMAARPRRRCAWASRSPSSYAPLRLPDRRGFRPAGHGQRNRPGERERRVAVIAQKEVELEPVRPWVVYILMHSHVDIGYTDIQPHIAAKQARNVTRALELIRRPRTIPPRRSSGGTSKWAGPTTSSGPAPRPSRSASSSKPCATATSAWTPCMAICSTGVSRGEELVHQLVPMQELGRRCGVTVDSMMISDVPGLTWGLIPASTQAGVKYISDGPNYADRIGWTRVTWEDRPFYWVAANGKDEGPLRTPYFGYAFGHTVDKLPDAVQKDLKQLEESGYPYDLVQIRWSKGDNGSADERVMQQVRDWNAQHASPRLVIATTSEMFHELEKRYADKIPTFRGDFTP